jgi:hypothetical protein
VETPAGRHPTCRSPERRRGHEAWDAARVSQATATVWTRCRAMPAINAGRGCSSPSGLALRELHEVASELVTPFASIRIRWIPWEMNVEPNRLVKAALATS